MKLIKNKKGNVGIYISFMISTILVLILSAFYAPMALRMNVDLYAAGEDILQDSQPIIDSINNTDVKDSINATVSAAIDSTQTNIDITSSFYKYGWMWIIGLGAFVAFIYSRRLVEYGSLTGGFV